LALRPKVYETRRLSQISYMAGTPKPQSPRKALEGRDADGILEAGQRRLAGQLGVLWGAVGEELEDGVGTEGIVVVLVLVAGEDAVDPAADHLPEGMLRKVGVAGVVSRVGEGPGEPDALVELGMGSSPVSLESWPGDGLRTRGVPKKSRTWGQAEGILSACPLYRRPQLLRQQVRRIRRAKAPDPAPVAGEIVLLRPSPCRGRR
jgi:hypothetical protein